MKITETIHKNATHQFADGDACAARSLAGFYCSRPAHDPAEAHEAHTYSGVVAIWNFASDEEVPFS